MSLRSAHAGRGDAIRDAGAGSNRLMERGPIMLAVREIEQRKRGFGGSRLLGIDGSGRVLPSDGAPREADRFILGTRAIHFGMSATAGVNLTLRSAERRRPLGLHLAAGGTHVGSRRLHPTRYVYGSHQEMTLYDSIGRDYVRHRKADPRILREVVLRLGDFASVVNVGAGTGSYEPTDRRVIALEPSAVMIRQRSPNAAPVVRGSATDLPFRDESFDVALAVLTMHHWPRRQRGLSELRRTARHRVVMLTWDPSAPPFWLADYFPSIQEIDRKIFPPLSELETALGRISVYDLLIPRDCTDGFLGAYWSRPEAYLRSEVRAAMSTFSRIDDVEPGLRRLQRDLESRAWERRYGSLRRRASLDLGYRLVVAD